MRAAADLAERYGTGELRTTNMQNLLIPHVRRERAGALARELEAAGLRLDASPFWRGTVACTGSEFCKLALTETKGFARALVEELESRLPGFDEHVKLHVTGCPNSCGQHWIADIGIEGKKGKVDGALADAYSFCGGGLVAERRVHGLLAADATVTVISPALTPTLAALASGGRLRHHRRGFEPGDLDGVDLAFAATDRGEVNAALFVAARARGVWVNAADDPAHCTFILPAVVRRGGLSVAVSTGGTSPALARAIREELERYLTAEYATLAEIAAEARRELRAAGRVADAETWRRALQVPEVRRVIVERGREEAALRLLAS